MSLGTTLLGSVVLGVCGGYLLDRWLGTKPWCLLTLSVLGVSAGIAGVLRGAALMGK